MPGSLRMVIALLFLGVLLAQGSLLVQRQEGKRRDEAAAAALTGGDPHAGRQAVQRYGCGACHQIPGIPRAWGKTGPSLDKIATRAFIAGRLPNRPDQMVAWLTAPQSINPHGGMPDMGVGNKDSRDLAAYLYTLR